MEIYHGEKSYRNDDDDGEEATSAGGGRRKKKKEQPRPPENTENRYFKLDSGKFGEFLLPKQPEWLGMPKSEKNKDKEKGDKDQRDEEENDAKPEGQSEEKESEPTKQADHQAENRIPAEPTAKSPDEAPHDALTGPAAEQDREKFDELMQQFSNEPLAKAASDELLTDNEPGRPAAVEYATNEREPVHTEQTYRAEQDQRVEGAQPGPSPDTDVFVTPPERPVPQAGEAGLVTATRPVDVAPGATPRHFEHRRGLRDSMNAAAIMTLAVAGWLAHRRSMNKIHNLQNQQKQQRRETNKQQASTEQLAASQQKMREQVQAQEARFAAERAAQQRRIDRLQESQAPFGQPGELASTPLQAPERPMAAPTAESTRPLHGAEASESVQKANTEAAARRAVEEARAAEEAANKPKQEEVQIWDDAWLRHEQVHGKEVQRPHGHEFDAERAQEIHSEGKQADKISANPLEETGGPQEQHVGPEAAAAGLEAAGLSDFRRQQPSPAQVQSTLESGIADSDHTLPAGMPAPVDWRRQLPDHNKRGPIVATLTSPWLFLMLSLILLAYFIASLL